jgi:hypothetical protein
VNSRYLSCYNNSSSRQVLRHYRRLALTVLVKVRMTSSVTKLPTTAVAAAEVVLQVPVVVTVTVVTVPSTPLILQTIITTIVKVMSIIIVIVRRLYAATATGSFVMCTTPSRTRLSYTSYSTSQHPLIYA